MNVTYLLGAGASCNALPLINNFNKKLQDFINYVALKSKQYEKDNPKVNGNYNIIKKTLILKTQWLIRESQKHSSIDTFAKKLYLKNSNDQLRDLKAILTTFFAIEQGRNNVDKRYDTFFASVIRKENNDLVMPSNIKILSWNYDTQIEKAYYGYVERKDLVHKHITFNKRQLFRFNGYCGTSEPGHLGDAFYSAFIPEIDSLIEGLNLFNECIQKNGNDIDIRYSWEESNRTIFDNSINEIEIEETNTLVVIGYSFPYFNREIDKKVFSRFKKLKKIYLQYPSGEHNSIEERIKSFNMPCEIIPISNTDVFYLPDEL
jgi:hypothetical protein